MTHVFAIVLALTACGCASSSVFVHPDTLNEVNEALERRWASIELTDGRRIDSKDVRVTPLETSFVHRSTNETQVVATAEVERISVFRKRGKAGKGALIGASPGLLLAGFGFMIWLRIDPEEESFGPGLAAALLLGAGAIAAPVGAIIGAVVGGALDKGEELVVYQAPVARYIQDP